MQRINVKIASSTIHQWFRSQGFTQVEFENGKTYIAHYWEAGYTSVKLLEKPGFDTYYKESFGGAVIIYDVSVLDGVLVYEGYCPIWLFGFWLIKLRFRKNPIGIFKYLKEGYAIEERFSSFLKSVSS